MSQLRCSLNKEKVGQYPCLPLTREVSRFSVTEVEMLEQMIVWDSFGRVTSLPQSPSAPAPSSEGAKTCFCFLYL